MAVAFRDSSTSGAGASPVSVPKPAGVADNDAMLMEFTIDDSGGTVTTPTGWTYVDDIVNGGGLFRTYLFRKVAAGEPANYSVSFTVATTGAGAIVAYSGVNTTTPIDTYAESAPGATATPASPSITPSVNDCMIVALFGNSNNNGGDTGTPDSSPAATERVDYSDTGALFIRHYIEDFLQGAAAAISLDFTNTISRLWTAYTVALKPAGVAGSSGLRPGRRIPTRLFGPGVLTTSPATKYTVPTGVRALLRHVQVSNPTGSVVGFTLSLGSDAAGTRIFDDLEIPADGFRDWFLQEWLEPGEVIQSFADTASALVLRLDGYERPAG